MIHARGLARTFRTKRGRTTEDVVAVAGVDLDVAEGEVVGFLEPNGAGRTTTLRMLVTLLSPTAGTATVAGHDVARDPVAVRRSIGYVSQSGSTSREAVAGEEVVDHGMLYGIRASVPRPAARSCSSSSSRPGSGAASPAACPAGSAAASTSRWGWSTTRPWCSSTSRPPAWTRRPGPTCGRTSGPLREGMTIFLDTHHLDEADALCDHILVIDHRQIVAADTPDALKRQVAGDLVELDLVDIARVPDAAAVLAGVEGAGEVSAHGRRVSTRLPHASSALPRLLREVDARGIALDAVEVRRPTLDDVFLTMTGRSLREESCCPPSTSCPPPRACRPRAVAPPRPGLRLPGSAPASSSAGPGSCGAGRCG